MSMTTQQSEKEVLDFWVKNKIYEKSVKQNAKGKKFYFMDGPPYASGHIHMGTALNKTLKDIAMRYQRLNGKDVFDRPGYDTHGVPIEFQVEKEIGSRGKQDIEKYGVKKFIDHCKKFATQYIDTMNDEFKDLGVWMDWKNPYLTLTDDYMEAIWDVFKKAEQKGLLYQGGYPVHICPRCATAVAYNEIEYGKQKDTSVFVKFPLKNKKNTFLIIWTTTPWTLPANTGVMVHPEVIYQEVEVMEGERWILAKELVPKVMAILERGYTEVEEYAGKKMEGWTYTNPLTKNLNLKLENAYRVVLSARYVTTEDGSGLVHTAPGHGKEDYEVGKANGLPAPCPVGMDGLLTEEAGKYAGKKARVVDAEIIKDLEDEGFLVYKFQYEHDYPLCWRDGSPLLMVSIPQWFLKISDIQKKLLKENEGVYWVPQFMKLRMKAWLEGIGDWPVSRQRYWGTPLPIWIHEPSGERIVVGSLDELKRLSGKKEIDMNKPGIDSIVIKKGGKEFHRVPEVLDVWFDSGVSSWAALGYPADKEKMKKYWPAELNIEGKDQFRGWWNSQMILSEIAFDRRPFDSIVVHGMVLDVSKNKMSKSKGNAVVPSDVIAKFGRDYMRYYFAKFSKGDDFSYDEKEFGDIRKVMTILLNINNYVQQLQPKKSKLKVEDKWMISRFNSALVDVSKSFEEFRFPDVMQRLESFIVNDLSRTYIQLTRERSDETYELMDRIRKDLLIMMAPIIPFVTEHLWQQLRHANLVTEESIHLASWPKVDKKKIDTELEKEFASAMAIIEKGLAERDREKIGLRWPLSKAVVKTSQKLDSDLVTVIAQQLNVKKIELKSSKESEAEVSLDTKLTPELEAEGLSRELARKIQAERKNRGLKKGDLIALEIFTDEPTKKMILMNEEFLVERTNARSLTFVSKASENSVTIDIKGKNVVVMFH